MGTSGKTSRTVAAAHTTAHTEPVPGMVYLRRPVGAAPVRDAVAGPVDGRVGRAETAPDSVLVGTGPAAPARNAAVAEIARLLCLWLEAFDGRRPVAALRRGPFSPAVLDELRSVIRSSLDHRAAASGAGHAPGSGPSRLLRVHLPPSHHRRLSFTASVAVSGRVRALVGHLGLVDTRWRVESVTLV